MDFGAPYDVSRSIRLLLLGYDNRVSTDKILRSSEVKSRRLEPEMSTRHNLGLTGSDDDKGQARRRDDAHKPSPAFLLAGLTAQ